MSIEVAVHLASIYDGAGMHTLARLNLLLWLAFYGYILISAIGVKKKTRRTLLGVPLCILSLVIAFLLFSRVAAFRRLVEMTASSLTVRIIGLLLCVLGMAFAVWARVSLGRNWGAPMTLSEGHELVTSGPYRLVRHPIYSGLLLAMLGSAPTIGVFWVLLPACGIYLVFSAKAEERLMAAQFPNQYPDYKKKTKMIVPFLC